MQAQVFRGIMIPFLGTAFGSACVLFMKNKLNSLLQRALTAALTILASGFVVPPGSGRWIFCKVQSMADRKNLL